MKVKPSGRSCTSLHILWHMSGRETVGFGRMDRSGGGPVVIWAFQGSGRDTACLCLRGQCAASGAISAQDAGRCSIGYGGCEGSRPVTRAVSSTTGEITTSVFVSWKSGSPRTPVQLPASRGKSLRTWGGKVSGHPSLLVGSPEFERPCLIA